MTDNSGTPRLVIRDGEHFLVPSATVVGKYYVVEWGDDGVFRCPCLGFTSRRICTHVTRAKDFILGRDD
jgi:hypothetical protein